MKKILILIAALASINAHAEWVSYKNGADADELYDSKFVSRDGSLVKLWTMTNFAKPMTSLEGKDYLSEKFSTCPYCDPHGYLTCEQYNQLLRGQLTRN